METKLRELQLTQLEILKVIDKVCRANDIPYSLYAGTLLGAVRHKGFIPWDDDLDICMSRENYNLFIQVWDQEKPAGYLLQNKGNAPAFPQSFTKIRKDHTTFLQNQQEKGAYHTGIFVDVFPIDRIPNGTLRQMLFRFRCMRYQLYTREFVPPKGNFLVKCVSALFLAVTPPARRMRTRENLLSKITRYSDNTQLSAIAIETAGTLRTLYPSDMLENYTELPFEDGLFMCFRDWDEHLRRKFGDYMQLPPESERTWRHHPLVIDFERNYDEIEGLHE